jgi:hypothetical protein
MPFQVIFDVSRQFPQYWWLLIIPVVMVMVGLGVFKKKPTSAHRVFIAFFLGFAVLLALLQSIVIAKEYSGLRSALTRGDFNQVEGVVTGFVPQHPGSNTPARFMVMTSTGPRAYLYSWSIVSQGFNGDPFTAGVLREGMRVRIADVDGQIAKLEVAR